MEMGRRTGGGGGQAKRGTQKGGAGKDGKVGLQPGLEFKHRLLKSTT